MVSTEIVEEICRYTTYFGEKTSGVSSWCSNRGLNYSKVESDRKRSRDSQGRKCRRRYLHILKDAYRGKLLLLLV
jgi:hypothetical protein